MRRILVATLAAIPALVSSQASTVQPSHVPAMLLARIAAAPAAPLLPAAVRSIPLNVVVHQAIVSDVDVVRSMARTPITVSVNEATAPELIKAVKTELTPQQAAAGVDVRVRLTVNTDGAPEDLSVISAPDSDVAKRALDAVRQYRFKPATVNLAPVATTIMVSINVH